MCGDVLSTRIYDFRRVVIMPGDETWRRQSTLVQTDESNSNYAAKTFIDQCVDFVTIENVYDTTRRYLILRQMVLQDNSRQMTLNMLKANNTHPTQAFCF